MDNSTMPSGSVLAWTAKPTAANTKDALTYRPRRGPNSPETKWDEFDRAASQVTAVLPYIPDWVEREKLRIRLERIANALQDGRDLYGLICGPAHVLGEDTVELEFDCD